jgi:hypothetical protein
MSYGAAAVDNITNKSKKWEIPTISLFLYGNVENTACKCDIEDKRYM